jgi:hypothetical protein
LVAGLCVAALVAPIVFAAQASTTAKAGAAGKPSRAADEKCAWEKFSDAALGLDAWVERCDYGSDRKVDFVRSGDSLAIRYSDEGNKPDPLIDVFALQAKETPEQAITRIFKAHTDPALVAKCELQPFRYPDMPTPAGAKRYTFLPNKAFQKTLDAKAAAEKDKDGDIPDPPCGDWGDSPDGIQYFEAQPERGATHVMFVRVGQDIPLFDEDTLRLK